MRNRKNYESGLGRATSIGYNPDGSIAWNDSWTFNQSFERSSIIDTVGWGQNAVTHTKFTTSPMSYTLPRTQHVTGLWQATFGCNGRYLLQGPTGLDFDSPDFTPAIDALMSDATGAMPMQAMALVNVIELKSVKEIVPQLISGFRGLLKHKVHKLSLKELANLNLLYQFGVAPLVSDFKAFLNIRGAVQKRIRQLENRSCRAVRLTQRTSPIVISKPVSIGSEAGGHIINGVWSGTVKGALSADVKSFFVNDASSQVKLYSSALGLSSPLMNAWEIVPFSFVADWFLPIGDTFQRIERKLGLHETVRSCSLANEMHSIKVDAKLHAKVRFYDSGYPGWSDREYAMPLCHYTSYIRQPGLPVCPLISPPSGWSLNRTGLSLSLVAQKAIKA
jgi:hypothetical protein